MPVTLPDPIIAELRPKVNNAQAKRLNAVAAAQLTRTADRSLLHLAAEFKVPELITALIARNDPVNVVDDQNYTPLHYAALQCASDMMRVLLRAGADPNIANFRGDTPLHEVTCQLSCDRAAMLLQHGADVNVRNMDGCTPVWLAARNGWLLLIQLLHQAGASLLTADNEQRTPHDIAKLMAHQPAADLIQQLLAEQPLIRS